MSSKYSQFRKTKHVVCEQQINVPSSIIKQFNIEEINQMMQVLNTPINLNTKQAGSLSKRQPKTPISLKNHRRYQSAKNSEANQSCDLTTTIDQESISNVHNAKLPVICKNISKRHHTQQQTQVRSPQQKLESPFKTQAQSQKNQSLLDDDTDEKEESTNIHSSQAENIKAEIFDRLAVIEQKLKVKNMQSNQLYILLEKINLVQAYIDQL